MKASLFIPQQEPQHLTSGQLQYLEIRQICGLCASVYSVSQIMGVKYDSVSMIENGPDFAVYGSTDYSKGRNKPAEELCGQLITTDKFGESEGGSDEGYLYGPILVIQND